MKKALLAVLAIVLVVVALVLAAPFLIPVDTYKTQIARQVEAQTGRAFTIGGDVSLSILPRTQLTAEQVSFANPDWAQEPQMLQLDRLQVRIDPLALLSGELQVESFVLQQPVIHLAVNPQGRGNWSFGQAGAEQPTTGDGGQQPSDGGAPSTGLLQDIGLQDVRLVDGRVTYTDMATGERQELSDVNLSLSLAGLDQPFSADGSVTWNQETVNVELDTGPPRQLMAGQATNVALQVDSNPVTLDYDGQVTNAAPRKVTGDVSIEIPSLRGLAAWAGSPIEAPEGTLERFQLTGTVNAEGQSYAFQADQIALDKIEGRGALSVDLGGQKPVLDGKLQLAQMNLTPYLPAPTEAQAAEGEGSGSGSSSDGGSGGGDGQPAGWSDEPLDLAALHAANATFDLSVEGIQAREVEVGRSALSLELKDGRLQADLTELNLYDGQGTGRIVVNARQDTPSIAKTFDLQGLNAQPFLTDVAGFERLEGTGNVTIDVTASGRSQKQMVEDLDGQGAIRFTDGAISGLNLAQMVRNVKSAFTNAGGTQKTDFAELAGTFTIQDGVLKNDDLLLLNPLLRVRGAGQADIGARTVDYRLTPKAVATTEGQGGEVQETGVAVPVIVEGPWHDVSYRPDLESIVRDALKDPERIKQQVEQLRQGGDLKSILQGIGGAAGGSGSEGQSSGGSSDSGTSDEGGADPAQQLKDDAEKALKGLFGN